MSRFAPITADILARKGDARPWSGVGESIKQPMAWQMPPPVIVPAIAPVVAPIVESVRQDERKPQLRRCTLRMSQHDYERLGILAVKQGSTRHRLLQDAVERLFTGMTENFGPSCRCLGAPGELQG